MFMKSRFPLFVLLAAGVVVWAGAACADTSPEELIRDALIKKAK